MLNPPTPEDIKSLRLKHQLSAAELAQGLYVNPRTVFFWEKGEREMPLGLWELMNIKLGEFSPTPITKDQPVSSVKVKK